LDLLNRQSIPYCLATNSRMANALECLDLAGLKEVFSIIVSRDHVQYGKPEPDIFLKAAEVLQVDISRCLVLEDSHAGIVAAFRAGAVSVFIPSIAQVDPLTVELCDLMIDDLAQLATAIRA
ncbi:MAG: HAD family phosphatase, partial [Methylobacter sp.]|nr:HAD family phosphatase [Methylobacter sp.]